MIALTLLKELILIKQVHRKSVMFFTNFLNYSFKFQTNVCNTCHDLVNISINLSDIANLNIKVSD